MKAVKKISVFSFSLTLCLILFIGLLNSTASAAGDEAFNYTSSVYYKKLAEDCSEYAMLAYDEMEVKI